MAKDRRSHSEEHVVRTGVFLYTVPGKYTFKVRQELFQTGHVRGTTLDRVSVVWRRFLSRFL